VTMDINELVGPEPIPVPAPKFPTPWQSVGNQVRDANHNPIFLIRGEDSRDTPVADRVAIAAFIAEAVNEKVANDAAKAVPSEPADDTEYFKSRGTENLYRIRAGSEFADAFYTNNGAPIADHVDALYVRNVKIPVSREDVPEAFRL
jgi:hypothetical protein